MTEQMPQLSVLERIQKLLKKAENLKQLGNEAEAMAFLDGANKLMSKHKLELTDVQLALREHQDPVKMHYVNPAQIGLRSKKARVTWEQALVMGTADAYYCKVLVIPNSNHFWLVGRRQDRQVAEFIIATLIRFAEQEADRAYVKYFYHCRDDLGDVKRARGFRANFLLAFTDRVLDRFKEEFKQVVQEGGQHALIRLNQEKAAVEQFVQKLRDMGHIGKGVIKAPKVNVTSNMAGLIAGRAAGDRAILKANAIQQQTTDKTRLLNDGSE